MKRILMSLTMLTVITSASLLHAATLPSPAAVNPLANVPVVGTVDGGGTFNGFLTVTRFVAQGDQLFALGRLTGTLTNAGGVVTNVNRAVRLPVILNPAQPATCEILDLHLGPLDLNLLGLVVHLDQINLNITAQTGSLLGDLLCAIANLLNGGGPLNQIAALLNQILGILNNL